MSDVPFGSASAVARRDSTDSSISVASAGSAGSAGTHSETVSVTSHGETASVAGSVASAAHGSGEEAAAAALPSKVPTEEEMKRSEVLKDEGNKHFAAGRYTAAIDAYNQAIEAASSAVLYGNRAFAQLKCENYGLALEDASRALAIDPSYVKAYYRRGSAYLALGKYKEARAEFRAVCKAKPADGDARAKLDECDKAIRKQAFEAAIATESPKPPSERIDLASIAVEASYKGPHLPALPEAGAAATPEQCSVDEGKVNQYGLSLSFVKAAMAEFKAQRLIAKKYVCELLVRLKSLLKTSKALVHVPMPAGAERFNVCGDTHGQYYDTLNIFDLNGLPSPTNPYVFNGDFVDRGSFSVENVLMLFMWKLLYPDYVHLTRGNHETRNMNKMYGFDGEVRHKYDQTVLDLFTEIFCALPLAVVIDRKVFVVHGGLFQQDGVKLDDIAAIDRFREPPDSGLMSDILWSDPQPFAGRGPSKRGVGQSFGPDVTARFLENNGLELVIRSHEVMDEGYQVIHNGKLITVFSAPNYCDQMNNKGGVVRLDRACKPSFLSFAAVPHPPVKPMAYATGMMSMFGL